MTDLNATIARKKDQNTVAIDRLYRAVAHYVKLNGGVVIVAGGIQVQQWPGEGSMNFHISVTCTGGRLPAFAEPEVSRKTKREAARDMKADMYGENGNG